MEIIAPLGIQAVTTHLRRTDQARIIQIAFDDQGAGSSQSLLTIRRYGGQFGQNMPGAEIVDGVTSVQSQAIEMNTFQPVADIFQYVFPHPKAVGTIVVNRIAPGRAVLTGEISAQPP